MISKFYIATKVFYGSNCVVEKGKEFLKYGKKALIVTGSNSAKKSGALDDVIQALTQNDIQYSIFDEVENNPSMQNVESGSQRARDFGTDFVIGIGGGSPLDASKAIAVLATNEIEATELFKNRFENKPLPIIAIPTTAGTGSEVTPYAILTRKDMETKMGFGNEDTFPKVAFVDAKYTESLSWEITANTAVDALSHSIEGYLCKRSTSMSDILAIESIRIFGECINALANKNIDFETREKLIYMSTLAGMVISHTGTTIVHGMGYSLTYFKNIPHGKANGILMEEYLRYNYDVRKEKIDNILKLLNMSNINEFGDVMDILTKENIDVTEGEIQKYAQLAMQQSSTKNNYKTVSEEDMINIIKKSLH